MYKVHVLYVSSHLLRRAGTLLNPRNSAAGPMVSQQVIGRSKEAPDPDEVTHCAPACAKPK
jgi:hypothetical protein